MRDFSALDVARLMRGNVPEWGDSYIEDQIPSDILRQLHARDCWTDDEGFWWGFNYVFATKLHKTGENVVVVASKPCGLGSNKLKVVMEDKSLRTVWSHKLLL
jgi:hypothetical protein